MNDYLVIGIGLILSLTAIVGIARLVEKVLDRKRSLSPFPIPEEAPLTLPDLPSSLPSVSFNRNMLFIGSKQYEHITAIKQVIPLSEIIVVLFDPFADNFDFEVSNLAGIDYSGNEVWRAELPSGYGIEPNPSHDSYMKITNTDPLETYSWSGFNCQIDQSNGQITESVFTK
jgi:hypothetical protein